MRYFKLLLLIFIFGLFSIKSFSQSIGTPEVSNTQVCAGSELSVTFNVTGNIFSGYFTKTSTFTAEFGIVTNNTINDKFLIEFQLDTDPPIFFFQNTKITKLISVPKNVPAGTNYVVRLSSSSPNATSQISNTFTITQIPKITQISNNGPICIGQTLNLFANSSAGATYSWTGPNGFTSTSQNPSISKVTSVMAGTYSVIATLNGCISKPVSTNVIFKQPTKQFNEIESGSDNWIGHVYDKIDFTNYIDGYREPLNFDQNFGGDTNDFLLNTESCGSSVYTETFSVKYKMNSTLSGLYVTDIGSDDGSRLTVDGNLIYNHWGDHAYRLNSNILIDFSGSSKLVLEYYENAGGNRINFANLRPLIKNELTSNTNQTLDSQNNSKPISGDVIPNLPSGISKVNTGYQWVYSTTLGGAVNNIMGATGATYTPSRTDAPFNNSGTYYIYRQVLLTSSNNVLASNYSPINKSNAAVITVKNLCTSPPTITLSESTSACPGEINISGVLTGVSPWTINATINGQPLTQSFSQATFSVPTTINETTTINITKITDGNSCVNNAPNQSITITVINGIQNNVISEDQEFCGNSNVNILEGTDLGSGYSYVWESSTTGNNSGFTTALGNNNSANYNPGTITQTTWYRRRVNVSNCAEDVSNIINITIGQEITGNDISYFRGNTDLICLQVDENATFNISSPIGTYFSYINFASYGTASGLCGNYSESTCHANNSQQIVESYLLGNNSASIPATNYVFGDPCIGTKKSLTVQATYSEPICIGSDPGTITGNLPTGGNGKFSYLWKVSTTGPNSGFNVASGINNNKDYSPGILNTNTWFQRTVSSGSCDVSLSSVLLIKVKNENIWTGAENTNWNNQDNWSCNMIPTLTTNVSIPSGLSNYPLLNKGSAGFCKDITVSSSATLEVLNNNLNISGVINNNGSFNAENGTVTLKGESSQSIPANTFTNNRISNLIIDNNLGASINGELEIKGILKVAIGNLNTKGFVTLISNASQTALIDGSGNGEIIGTVKLQRYLDSARGYKYFSSPFSNSTVGDFSNHVDLSASFPQVYFYKENNKSDDNKDISGWKSYTNASSGLATLAGYAFNFGTSEDAATIKLSGIVNNGSYSRQVSNNNGKYTQGFNLVGNPYPSPIDWNATGWTKINVDDAIYFFSANAQYTGTYSSFVNGVSSSGASSPGIIPTMQGFFVHVSDGRDPKSITTGTLGVSNSVRVNDFNQPFYKRSDASPKGLIRIIADINDNISKDAMVIYFDPFATENFDTDKDALKLMNIDKNVPNLYSLNKDQNKLSISSLPEIAKNSTKRIPLGINMEVGGELRLHLKDLENLPSNFNVYLIDDEKHIGQNLSQKPVYKTQIKAGEYNSRFYLIFSESEINDAAVVFDEPFSIKTVDGQVLVKMNLKDGEKGILQATTVTGQILERKDAKGIETIHLNGIKSSGLYFINLSWNNQQFSRKIIIQK